MEQTRNTTCVKWTKNAYKIMVGNPEGEHTCVRKDDNKENLK